MKRGVTEGAVEKAVSLGITKAAPKRQIGKAAAAADAREAMMA